MTKDEIREIVRITLEELTAKSTVSYQEILRVMDKQLYSYFETTDLFTNDITVRICSILNKSNDPYIHIIYYQYRDHKTIEWIAEHMQKDVSTIKRNKKRIIIKMYEELYK